MLGRRHEPRQALHRHPAEVRDGDEFEYYFVLIDSKRIIAKSPQIYHTKAEAICDAPFTRHATLVTMQRLPPGSNPMATSAGAGYAITGNNTPPVASPDNPAQAKKP